MKATILSFLVITAVSIAWGQAEAQQRAGEAATTPAAKRGEISLTKEQYEELQKLQKALSAKTATEKKCHIEYRNCWVDIEYKCWPQPDGYVECIEVPVRRCGKPEMICE